ncbi:Bug family tripartite tricarboxylate transporter substrate binding protein [Stutzerimonas urumqiensis]|uniref:Bug family tripartite tricarboxylate transporter substrate binding protein n=1 Tax=Stutzerimonas urumqiensis TaxID=638269 RepID=UPI000EAE7D78|nr:tripartite tricarboxylate transporter substrate binding protein [Stutzerimonas urumqiensis]
MKKTLRTAIASACIALTAGIAHAAETEWPSRTVQVIVPAGAGGDTDFNARTMAKYFSDITGENMVITNMNGGGGTVALAQVKNAEPDGTTILFGHTGHLLVNEVSGLIDYSYDALDICCIAAVDKGAVFVTSKASGIETLDELIKKAKESPDDVIYGTELGGFSHLQGLIFEDMADVDLKIVDAGSAAEKITALLGGRIDVAAITYGAVQDYVETGDMHILAQPNEERNPLLGDIKTFKEQGLDFVMDKPYIIAFPKGTDPAIVQKMSDIMKQITETPAYAKELEKGFKQPVTFYGHDVAPGLLKETRTDYMQYRDLLRQQ